MKIVILSRNTSLYSTKRLVQAAQSRGHQVKVLDHLKCFVGIESGNPVIYYNDIILENIDAVIPRIGASVTLYGTAVVRQFEMMQVYTANKALAITRSRDKLRTLQLPSKAGLQVPKTVYASRTKNIDALIDYLGDAPVIIKLLEGTQGIGVVLAENRKVAKSVVEAFYGIKADILIQEFIKESGGADIRAFVVDGKVVGAIKRQGRDGEFRSNLHRGGRAEAIKLTDQEEQAAVAAAKAMDLGIAGVDMLRSNRGPLIIEINSSPGLEGIEKFTGIDIAGYIIELLEKYGGKQ